MTAALEGASGQQHGPAALYPRETPGTHCIGGWVAHVKYPLLLSDFGETQICLPDFRKILKYHIS